MLYAPQHKTERRAEDKKMRNWKEAAQFSHPSNSIFPVYLDGNKKIFMPDKAHIDVLECPAESNQEKDEFSIAAGDACQDKGIEAALLKRRLTIEAFKLVL